MTTTPGNRPDHQGNADEEGDDVTATTPEGAGAEIGIAEGEGSTFEPEEDGEGADDR